MLNSENLRRAECAKSRFFDRNPQCKRTVPSHSRPLASDGVLAVTGIVQRIKLSYVQGKPTVCPGHSQEAVTRYRSAVGRHCIAHCPTNRFQLLFICCNALTQHCIPQPQVLNTLRAPRGFSEASLANTGIVS